MEGDYPNAGRGCQAMSQHEACATLADFIMNFHVP